MPVDRCSVLFFPRGSAEPLVAGTLRLLPGMKGTVFQYAPSYIENPAAIALDPIALPLQPGEVVTPRDGDSLVPDAFSDAGPDAWGRMVIDRTRALERSSEFDYLFAAGPNRTGALDFVIAGEARPPLAAGIGDLAEIETAIDRVRRKLPLEERYRDLLALGTSAGGMRPKMIVEMDGALWIAKFNARDEDFDAVSLEYAGMWLAERCGIAVPPVRKHGFGDQRIALLVRRFDREPLGERTFGRIPYLSARALLRSYGRDTEGAAPAEFSYVLLADVRRLVGRADTVGEDLRELFRRMVFNILIDNTDDHERNHGFLHDGGWRLAPAFDLSSQVTGLGYQAMKVGVGDTSATLVNALSECGHFGLARADALEAVNELIHATDGLDAAYREAGVDERQSAAVARTRERIVAAFRARPVDGTGQPAGRRKTTKGKRPR